MKTTVSLICLRLFLAGASLSAQGRRLDDSGVSLQRSLVHTSKMHQTAGENSTQQLLKTNGNVSIKQIIK